jgi:hypothetical protein
MAQDFKAQGKQYLDKFVAKAKQGFETLKADLDKVEFLKVRADGSLDRGRSGGLRTGAHWGRCTKPGTLSWRQGVPWSLR